MFLSRTVIGVGKVWLVCPGKGETKQGIHDNDSSYEKGCSLIVELGLSN